MSDVKAVNDIHQAVKTDLQRRRELAGMTKPELIDYIVSIEDNLAALAARIDACWDE